MVQGKKPTDLSNGSIKHRDQQSNMAFQRSSSKNDGRPQNGTPDPFPWDSSMLTLLGNSSSFRTDTAISGGRTQGERTLQRWVPDTPEDVDTSLESVHNKSSGPVVWDQFAVNERLFNVTTDYDENIYTTTIDKNHPQYKQRLADADKKAREIERSVATNSHVAEERIADNFGGKDNGMDEEDK
jgi:PAB1-binding protein PBP1